MAVLLAKRIRHRADGTPLTDTPTTDEWEDWGEEVLTFDRPGTEVEVIAFVSGYVIRDGSNQDVRVRVLISFDGGVTFSVGNDPNTTAGTGAGGAVRQNVTAQHHRRGIPDGEVVIKAQTLNATAGSGSQAVAGRLEARIRASRRQQRPSGTVLFFDDFEGSSLSSFWFPHDHEAEVNDDQQAYTPDAITVANSLATITADEADPQVHGEDYTSGLVTTAGRYSFGVGSRYEINCRLPGGGASATGYWASSYLLGSAGGRNSARFGGLAPGIPGGTQLTGGNWPLPGWAEVDVVEHAGLNLGALDYSMARHVSLTPGVPDSETKHLSDAITPTIDLTSTFNTYGFVWRSDSITWEFNGDEVFRLTAADTILPHEPMFIIFNFALAGPGSGFEEGVDGNTVFPATFDVDWVRVTAI